MAATPAVCKLLAYSKFLAIFCFTPFRQQSCLAAREWASFASVVTNGPQHEILAAHNIQDAWNPNHWPDYPFAEVIENE